MIILDSNVLVSYEVDKDINHDRAVKLLREVVKEKFGKVFTSDYIFDETVTVTLVKTKNLRKAILAGTYIMDSTNVLKIKEPTFEEAWKLFRKQKETRFSFTDCTILALMREKGIKNIATFDEDFQKVKGINVIS